MMSLFERMLKGRSWTLSNGKTIHEKASRAPVFVLLLLALTFLSVRVTGFRLDTLLNRGHEFFVILSDMFPPRWSYLHNIWKPLADTIKMSLLGSATGSILALPAAVAASRNINSNKFSLVLIRFLLGFLRTIPTLVYALVATYIMGMGTAAGTLSIAIFTFSYVGKQLYERIEVADMGPYEAMEALGAGKIRAYLAAIQAQILPNYLSVCLFCFEGNVRYASILGYVGAGGLGLILNEKIGWREYSSVGMILLVLYITVMLIEEVSQRIRKHLV